MKARDMETRAYTTVREAVHATVTGHGSIKELAGILDVSPSFLSAASTLGDGEHLRHLSEAQMIAVQQVTGNHSILATMAALLGYDIRPQADQVAESVDRLRQDIATLIRVMEGRR